MAWFRLAPMWLLAAVVLSGCRVTNAVNDIKDLLSRTPEVEGLTEALKTSVPLAYAASVAMSAVHGDIAPGVSFVSNTIQTQPSFTGAAVVAIELSRSHRLPVGADTSGTILVGGLWNSADQAVITVAFTHLSITQGTFTLSNISTVPVMRDSNEITIVYASEDINQGSDTALQITMTQQQLNTQFTRITSAPSIDSSVSVSQDAWIVRVDRNHTYADPGDDTYTVTGASQYAAASLTDASIVQRVLIETAVGPDCRRNPVAGNALIRNVDAGSGGAVLGTTWINFHSGCDGLADVILGTGNYLGSTGTTVGIGLDR